MPGWCFTLEDCHVNTAFYCKVTDLFRNKEKLLVAHAPDTRMMNADEMEAALKAARAMGMFEGFPSTNKGWLSALAAAKEMPRFTDALGPRFPGAPSNRLDFLAHAPAGLFFMYMMEGPDAAKAAAEATAAAPPRFLTFEQAQEAVPAAVAQLSTVGKSFAVSKAGYDAFRKLQLEEGGLAGLPTCPGLTWKGKGWSGDGYKQLMRIV